MDEEREKKKNNNKTSQKTYKRTPICVFIQSYTPTFKDRTTILNKTHKLAPKTPHKAPSKTDRNQPRHNQT
jgi:hypothetical protein